MTGHAGGVPSDKVKYYVCLPDQRPVASQLILHGVDVQQVWLALNKDAAKAPKSPALAPFSLGRTWMLTLGRSDISARWAAGAVMMAGDPISRCSTSSSRTKTRCGGSVRSSCLPGESRSDQFSQLVAVRHLGQKYGTGVVGGLEQARDGGCHWRIVCAWPSISSRSLNHSGTGPSAFRATTFRPASTSRTSADAADFAPPVKHFLSGRAGARLGLGDRAAFEAERGGERVLAGVAGSGQPGLPELLAEVRGRVGLRVTAVGTRHQPIPFA